ncbi:MAG: DUF6605 domain-containing protein [Dehalococcoidia bacterium]
MWVDTPIRGYAGDASVNRGSAITLFVSTAEPTYTIEVYRLGWYGGMGATLVLERRRLPRSESAGSAPQSGIGLIDAGWSPSYTLQTGAAWTSGVYLVKLTAKSGAVGYISFVLRADGTTADIVHAARSPPGLPTTNWGGKSLYDFNSDGGRAYKVSFNRPSPCGGWRSFFDGDYNMVRWLEAQGYDVTYVTNTDLEANPAILNGRRMFLSNFHDEYWSKAMRDTVTAGRDRGMHMAWFGANNVYWQVRLEADPFGAANRVMVCYKDAALDPLAGSNPQVATVNSPPASDQKMSCSASCTSRIGATALRCRGWCAERRPLVVQRQLISPTANPILNLVGYEYDKVWNNGFDTGRSHGPVSLTSNDR